MDADEKAFLDTLNIQTADLRKRVEELERVITDILHQRTSILGLKVEDDLIRENEPLYLRALASTQPHP